MPTEDAPSVEEIMQLTRSALTLSQDDPIAECGPAALDLLPRDPDMCLQVAYQHLHDVPYKDVRTCWRRLYTDAALYKVLDMVGKRDEEDGRGKVGAKGRSGAQGGREEIGEDWVTQVVRVLDMALILTGAPRREEVVELWFRALEGVLAEEEQQQQQRPEGRPAKRRRVDTSFTSSSNLTPVPQTFATNISSPPTLRFPIPRVHPPSLEVFQNRVSNPDKQTPLIIECAIEHWPALDDRPWNSPNYLLEKTLGGRRLVPVEIGRSYTDRGWGQKILSFGDFMREYMLRKEESLDKQDEHKPKHLDGDSASSEPLPNDTSSAPPTNPPQTGYLAQHDLFAQIPSLRSDISIPDYCYTTPAPQPSNPSNIKPVAHLEEPLLNAWFGPAQTISPLHTDPYHNILAQVVGYKYVRLYPPDQTEKLYSRSVDDNGVDMSNTSEVDLDEAMQVWKEVSCWKEGDGAGAGDEGDEERRVWNAMFGKFRKARYVEGVLAPGECLYIPVGYWHYVRSLTASFSVSFWWN